MLYNGWCPSHNARSPTARAFCVVFILAREGEGREANQSKPKQTEPNRNETKRTELKRTQHNTTQESQ